MSKSRERMEADIPRRFWVKVRKTECCWLWTGCRVPAGYGTFTVKSRRQGPLYAHRVAWELAHGSIPSPPLQVLHRCDQPSCVNPDHLFIGTQSENMYDRWNKGRRRVAERKCTLFLSCTESDN